MCLRTVTKTYHKPQKKEFWAWKQFKRSVHASTILLFPFRQLRRTFRVPQGRWLKAEGKRPLTIYTRRGYERRYTPGFHVFATKPKVNIYGPVTVRVKVRGLVATGTQARKKCFVVRAMFVPKGVQ